MPRPPPRQKKKKKEKVANTRWIPATACTGRVPAVPGGGTGTGGIPRGLGADARTLLPPARRSGRCQAPARAPRRTWGPRWTRKARGEGGESGGAGGRRVRAPRPAPALPLPLLPLLLLQRLPLTSREPEPVPRRGGRPQGRGAAAASGSAPLPPLAASPPNRRSPAPGEGPREPRLGGEPGPQRLPGPPSPPPGGPGEAEGWEAADPAAPSVRKPAPPGTLLRAFRFQPSPGPGVSSASLIPEMVSGSPAESANADRAARRPLACARRALRSCRVQPQDLGIVRRLEKRLSLAAQPRATSGHIPGAELYSLRPDSVCWWV